MVGVVFLHSENTGQAAALGHDLAVRIQIDHLSFVKNHTHQMLKALRIILILSAMLSEDAYE
jgi:hypothetical protein